MGKTEAPAKPKTIGLVSPHRNLWISLTTNVDDYSGLGGMRTLRRGERVRFRQGRAEVPAEWRDAVESTPGFNRDFFLEEDPRAALRRADGGPQVVAGQVLSRLPQVSDEPPLEGWDDDLGARGIRAAIEAGEVEDLQAALMWETRPRAGKARTQVIDALGKAIRAAQGPDEDEDEDEKDPETGNDDGEKDTSPDGNDDGAKPSDEGGL